MQLFDINSEISPKILDVRGNYDRDSSTRKITAIYLKEGEVIQGSHVGTLENLMKNPNVERRG